MDQEVGIANNRRSACPSLIACYLSALKKLYLVVRERERERDFCQKLSTHMYMDIVSVNAGYRHTTYEKEPQVNEIVNQPQLSSSLVIE